MRIPLELRGLAKDTPRPAAASLAGLAALAAAETQRDDKRRGPRRLTAQERQSRKMAIAGDRAQAIGAVITAWLDDPQRLPSIDIWSRAGADAVDALDCLIRRGGPYELTFCTFAVGESSLRRLAFFKEAGDLTEIHAVVDGLMTGGHRATVGAAVRQTADRYVSTGIHAKAFVLWPTAAGGAAYTITGSANLTANPRTEILQVSSDEAIAAFYRDRINDIFREKDAEEEKTKRKRAARG